MSISVTFLLNQTNDRYSINGDDCHYHHNYFTQCILFIILGEMIFKITP